MRYLIKGGVWKNSEDEILKAAVMKYGLNQWSRISSLLVRKSANQCKQRWYEWLDPSIKKTEWTREEEEKLLHLAKIFPQQWRTIAPLVGRTPQQCFDQYERLLDKAQGRDSNDPSDPRKLKPGEIDPNPESKPPRPDPIDMDEDEKEMLAEARVRLANTKGKKAKRKMRGKMIEESRRLAQLQKKRELKAAGIDYLSEFKKKKKRKGIEDFNSEVIFERLVPDYIYDTDISETPNARLNFQSLSFYQIESKNRMHEEEVQKKVDNKRIKKLKDKDMGRALELLNQDQDFTKVQATKLVLPEPQLQDKDLELLGKMNQIQEASNIKNKATNALVGQYSQKEVSMTPMRTPQVADAVMREARNAIALQTSDTPLIGGQNQELSSDLGLNGNKQGQPQTPNALQKLIQNPKGLNIITPINAPSQTATSQFAQTPNTLRGGQTVDWEEEKSQFSGLNDIKLQKLRIQAQRLALKQSLQTLPKPKNDYQIDIPELDAEVDDDVYRMQDQEEIEAKEKELLEQEIQRELRKRSLAIQMNMPRPFIIPNMIYDHIYQQPSLDQVRVEAESMLEQEMIKILNFDAQNNPFHGCKLPKFLTNLDHYTQDELNNASNMIFNEIQYLKVYHPIDEVEYVKKHQEILEAIVFDPSSQQIIDLDDCEKDEDDEFMLYQAESRKNIFLKEQKKLEQMEQKQRIKTGGFQKILSKNVKEIQQIYDEISQKTIQLQVYLQSYHSEQRSLSARIDELRQYYAKLEYQNQMLIQREQDLIEEREELLQEEDLFSNLKKK